MITPTFGLGFLFGLFCGFALASGIHWYLLRED